MFGNLIIRYLMMFFCRGEIVQLIEQSLLFRQAFKSVCDFWESLKTDMKSLSISYSRRKSRIRCREKFLLTNQLIC